MKWSDKKVRTPKKETYYRTARKKNCRVTCKNLYIGDDEYFYYTIKKQDYEYNSFTYGHLYIAEADCMAAVEKHIDNMSAKSNVNVNKEQLLGFLDVVESILGKEVKEWVSQKFLR